MCPQKWNASASPGLTSAETASAPAASASIRETRARKPRRDVDAASSSVSAATSGMDRLDSVALGGREDPLELAVAVERSFRTDMAVAVECDRIGTPGDVEGSPHVRLPNLVDFGDRDERIPAERRDDRLERPTEPTPVRREDRQRQPAGCGVPRAGRDRDARAERRSLLGDVECRLGAQP